MTQTDAFIAGGGPAGLAAAIAIRGKGFSVMLADHAIPPIDKACGEGLMPDSIAALKTLGVEISSEDGAGIRGIRFLDNDTAVAADFATGAGMAVRRTVLHKRLVSRAAELGVEMIWGAKRVSLDAGCPVVDGSKISSRFIVGADGLKSTFRDQAGLSAARYQATRFGFRRHFQTLPWSNYVEIYWGRKAQIFLAPTGMREVALAVLSPNATTRVGDSLEEFPALRDRLKSCAPTSSERGAITITRRLRRVTRSNVALIGDASGSVDSITGQGMCLAFRQALALADSIAEGSLKNYQRRHEAINRRARVMTRLMLLLAHYPRLRRRILRVFASEPELFAKLLAIHVGEGSFGDLGARDLLYFA
ncbi:MAG TPA: FAD-dependent monooxygenase [Bryobacteraceae bacterium]|nr:FAD-dependent monooxygenase [Bryobacteraceae bacterium]